MKKLLLTTLSLLMLCSCSTSKTTSKTKMVLDTYCTITLYDSSDTNILEECFSLCDEYELIFSMHNSDSELHKLNHNTNKNNPHNVSDELYEVLLQGYKYSKLTHGLFDITIGSVSTLWDFDSNNPSVPTQENINNALKHVSYKNIVLDHHQITYLNQDTMIDLGSNAKGYIADKIKEYLLSQDVHHALINLGGNILCVGNKNNENFKIGIDNPKDTSNQIITLSINDKSVVTSGTYQRCFKVDDTMYHHLLNPTTGYPMDNDISSVTIISNDSFMGDTLSTVCFALGKDEGLKLINSLENTEACYIDKNNQISYSENFKEYVIKS